MLMKSNRGRYDVIWRKFLIESLLLGNSKALLKRLFFGVSEDVFYCFWFRCKFNVVSFEYLLNQRNGGQGSAEDHVTKRRCCLATINIAYGERIRRSNVWNEKTHVDVLIKMTERRNFLWQTSKFSRKKPQKIVCYCAYTAPVLQVMLEPEKNHGKVD